jgi:hypothetical protein
MLPGCFGSCGQFCSCSFGIFFQAGTPASGGFSGYPLQALEKKEKGARNGTIF